ncbi:MULTISPECIES: hypothetical protein [Pseudanabaena]|uniref:Uncharacterized protein n=2 Tax=Pseudanabaena TaxID=1152 RepID=L8N184_9CYAN|nr:MULTISPECIES: hypothetical protein [Pseudanabaena]ELS32804.1 hypothetical protein Pse7429DRAFT_2009 [Pseudanabaena biceps PCC 7429]MDG3494993.1 hypothetical protein [Pseudanabaena catenata USMAC16]
MSELTKIAAILFKNLSDALLTTASELSNLDAYESKPTFTQADDKPPLLAPEKPKLITRYQYEAREKVLVLFEGASSPTRYRILKRIDSNNYIVYPQNASKALAREVNIDQILGLDPDR